MGQREGECGEGMGGSPRRRCCPRRRRPRARGATRARRALRPPARPRGAPPTPRSPPARTARPRTAHDSRATSEGGVRWARGRKGGCNYDAVAFRRGRHGKASPQWRHASHEQGWSPRARTRRSRGFSQPKTLRHKNAQKSKAEIRVTSEKLVFEIQRIKK